MFEAIKRVYAVDPNCLFSVNYLLAQDDYNNFIDMMLDYKRAFLWTEDGGQEEA